MNELFATVAFLTRLPVPRRSWGAMWSPVWFPVAGAVIGGFLAATAWLTGPRVLALPADVSAWLVTAAWVMLTGGLHLDGLMDTADGLLSGRPAPQALDIMRDSRVGGMGVLAAVLLLMGKSVLIGSILTRGGGPAALVLIPLWARWGCGTAVELFPYARSEGLASGYFATAQGDLRPRLVTMSTMAAIGTVLVLLFSGASLGVVVSPAIVAIAVTSLLGRNWSCRFGGLTGDLYGALIELSELLALLLVVIVAG